MEPWQYEKTFSVETYHSDFLRTLSVPGMFRLVQSIATEHIRLRGFGEDILQKSHCAFVLTKAALTIHGAMATGETIRLITTAYAPEKIYFHRNTDFFGEDGALRAQMQSEWVLVDTESMRILRRSDAVSGFPFLAEKAPFDFSIEGGGNFENIGAVRAGYTAVDLHRHMNNAVYADIAMDAMSDKLFCGGRPKRFLISYHRQVPMGGIVELQRDGEKCLIRGLIEGQLSFEAFLEFV